MCLRTSVYGLAIALGLLCRVAYMVDYVPSEKLTADEISALQVEADRLERLRVERIVLKGLVK